MSEQQQKKEFINPQRLEKLFTSNRDLTLSNRSNQRSQPANKTSFAPNLKVVRNKNLDNGKSAVKEPNKNDTRQRKNKEEKPPVKKANNYIQTFGILSEGIAQHQRKYSTRENASESESISRPRISVKQEEITKKSDIDSEHILANLIGAADEEDYKMHDDEGFVKPIKIKKYEFVKPEQLLDITIKKEPIDNFENEGGTQIAYGGLHDEKPNVDELTNMMNLFNPNELMVFQFPDTLPGKSTENEEDQETEEKSEEISNLQVKSKIPKLFSFPKLDDGLIGKIVRYKSGKTKFLLGESVYNIERGAFSEFQQNVVEIDTNEEQRSTNLYNLGSIKDNSNYVITPDWEWLFKKISE